MNFAEITEVVPWIELAADMGIDLDGEQAGEFRAFKSHRAWQDIGKGARYIYIVRDPKDSAISHYNFMNGWFIEPGSISLNCFVPATFLRGPYWSHLLSWWPARERDDVLFLCYENMREDLVATVNTVAAFTGVTDPQAIAIATEQSSFKFMSAHNNQFDDNTLARLRNAACGLPADAISSKVKSGKVGGHKALLSEEVDHLLDQAWTETITATLGFADYEELRAALSPLPGSGANGSQ